MAEAAVLAPLGWLASPLIKMLLDKVHDYLGTGIDERKKILAATVLPRLSLAIEKAEKSPNKDKLVYWLRRLKGAYGEAEEAIDLLEYENLEQQVKDDRKIQKQKQKSKTGTRISLPSQIVPQKLKDSFSIFSQKKIKLKVCIDKLIEIANEANEFRDLLEVQENCSHSDADRETISNPPARVFGREVDKENIVGLLMKKPLNSEPGPSTRLAIPIIAITGRSGVGKTTLAQYVFKHMDGQEYFDLLIWVHAPRKFKAIDVIKNMIDIMNAKECASNDNHSTSLEALLTQTRRRLGSQKLLLVLDDFWSDTEDFDDQWKNFICCCSSSLIGSRILLTTQSKNAAEQACIADVTAVETYYLKEIEEGQFSDLFMHYAWPSNCQFPKEEFEKIGQKIAVKLKGDPGTAKLVGHQMGRKLDLRHWEEVAEKDWSGNNMKARIWSYQQLPLNLQCCFAICSLLPKGIRFPRQLLITLWMAQGFIRPTKTPERLEDIGESYFCELVSRFFLEQVRVKEEIYCELHDLLHDLAEQVQGDDIIRIDNTNCEEVPSHISHMLSRSSENIRHISLPSSTINKFKEKLCLMKNIRTFCVQPNSVVPKKVLQDILKNFEKLRVLFLPECGDDLPEFIGNLKHLRYLNIYGSRPIKKLPDSICKLYHLQTLVLPYCESLPKDFSELISLRYFETVRDTMFHMSDVGRLTSLQCLDQFVVKKECGNELHQLENLNMLRGSLFITGLENVGSIADAEKANMQNKEHLKELKFEWNSNERDTKDVTSLSTQHVQLLEKLQPHPNINVLTLTGFGGDRFPNWLLSQNSIKHLTTLQLCYCAIEEISSIDKSLPSCTSLILKGLKNLKQMPSLPPKLTYLVVDDVLHLSYISEDDLLMKEERKHYKLEVVKQIEQCLKLQYVLAPHNFGLTVREFVKFVRERLEASPEICITSSQLQIFFSEIVKYDLYNDNYSLDQLLDAWVLFMHYHIETMFIKNEGSKLVLPSSLTYLKISLCSITSDALSTCIQSLVSLSKLELCHIQTITSLPPKEVLCSLKSLQSISIQECYLLSSLGGIGALTSLIELALNNCINLSTSNESLPLSLERLRFVDCSNVDDILVKSNLPVLRILCVWNTTFKNQRGVLHIGHLSCLEILSIVECDCRLEGLNSLTSLYTFVVLRCPEINFSTLMDKNTCALRAVEVDNPLLLKLILSNEIISSLDTLSICFFQGDSLDDEVFQSLTSLKTLILYKCNNIHLPKNLKNHASLLCMNLFKCPNLSELGEIPQNLRVLEIKDCPSLREKFNKAGPYRVLFNEGRTIVIFLTAEERNRF